jgi:hypothetical protein
MFLRTRLALYLPFVFCGKKRYAKEFLLIKDAKLLDFGVYSYFIGVLLLYEKGCKYMKYFSIKKR